MFKYAGEITIPAVTKNHTLKVVVVDGIRAISKRDLERLFANIGIDGAIDVEVNTTEFSDGYVSHRAMVSPLFREYMKFNNSIASIIFKGLTRVGIVSLIDEATGYQYARGKTELVDMFNENLKLNKENKDV